MEKLKQFLEEHKNSLVLVFFQEGEEPISQKGILKDFDDNFVYLETNYNDFMISLKDIIKLKLQKNGK